MYQEEFKKIANGPIQKTQLISFGFPKLPLWRELNLIKTYYSKVEKANEMFTSHLEGWKTDRGMISIILVLLVTLEKQKMQKYGITVNKVIQI